MSQKAFNLEGALVRVDGDKALLFELLVIFAEKGEQMLVDIESAVVQGDAVAIQHTSHRIKGSLQILGAETAAQIAETLEHCGRDNQLELTHGLLKELQSETARFMSAASEFQVNA